MVARGLEGVVLVLPVFVFLVLPEVIEAIDQERDIDVSVATAIGVATQTALFALEVALVVLAGGSLGKLLVGLRVRAVEGGRPTWRQAAVRTAIYSAFPVSLLVLAVPRGAPLTSLWNLALLFSIIQPDDRRGWHDRAAGTLVVRRA